MLYLFPNVLSEEQRHQDFFPLAVDESVSEIQGLIAEGEKNARAFLKRFTFSNGRTFRDIPIKLLNEHTTEGELKQLLEPLLKKEKWGLISDCGLPCLADPGARLVALAHKQNIAVKAFPGPSAVVMALMLSGFVVQAFTFHGYLPRELPPLTQAISEMEKDIRERKRVQVFIEAPYRNQKLLETLLEKVSPSIMLSLVCDVTLPTEEVIVMPISQWKKREVASFNKRPAVFLLGTS